MGTFTTSMQGMVDIRSQYSYQELFHDEDAKSDEKKKQKNQKKEITLKNCSSLAKSYINTMIRQKKSNNLFGVRYKISNDILCMDFMCIIQKI